LNHPGPYGEKCGVLPEYKQEDEGTDVAIKDLTSKFGQLMQAFSSLTVKVDAICVANGAGASPQIKTEEGAVGGGLLLPKPSWNVDKNAGESDKPVKSVETKVVNGEEKVSTPTTQTLSRDKELSRLLEDYHNAGVQELIGAQDQVNASLNAVRSSGERVGSKPLLIPDYISNFESIVEDEEDSFVTTKGKTFSLQQKKKPAAGEVTVAQWITANVTILELLIPTFSAQQIADYLKYTQIVRDLLQLYTPQSVFCYDNAHRKEVCRMGKRWNEVSIHQQTMFLSKIRNMGSNAGVDGGRSKSRRNRFTTPCAKYNLKEGCAYKNQCRFPHVCSEKGCGGTHPAFEHNESFRSQSGGNQATT
jgi:hypothetical protein